MSAKGLLERLKDGQSVICAEGYLWEFESRGYLQAGGFFPEIVLEQPQVVKHLHEEFVHAGSDVVEAFTFYAHREKMSVIGREDDREQLNRTALRMAREVATATNTLMAGNICNTGLYVPNNKKAEEEITEMFKEQTEWAVEEGADFIIAETFNDFGEGMLALQAIQKYGKGLPAVVTLAAFIPDHTTDGVAIEEGCRRLEEAGAAVVGINCGRGPKTMMPLLKKIRNACKGPIAALPVPFRTNDSMKTFHSLKDPDTGKKTYPVDLQCHLCKTSEIRQFAEEAKALGVQYIGLCCGGRSNYIREIAHVYGKQPPASRYAPDLSKSFIYGDTSDKYCGSKELREHMSGSEEKKS